MKIAVVGLWHLGIVTAACLAHKKFDVIAYDPDADVIAKANEGIAPIHEPGINEFIKEGLADGHLTFTDNAQDISSADVIWVTYDTPVDDNDNADVEFVFKQLTILFPYFKQDAVVIISSQLPVGSTRKVANQFSVLYPDKNVTFACSPENLRLGNAIKVFLEPDRIILGLNNPAAKDKINQVLSKITESIVWMSVESAEMTKHAINAFLATSVVFINELSVLCEEVGANAREVEQGLKSEMRIGRKAYLKPGNAFAGGTLARDIQYLIATGKRHNFKPPLLTGVLESNLQHKQWVEKKLLHYCKGELKNKRVAILGLTYKPGTDTLRRSSAIEMCLWLEQQQAKVVAYDPVINALPSEYAFVDLQTTADAALADADVVVIFTPWPEFTDISNENFAKLPKNPVVIDVTGLLYDKLSAHLELSYATVGRRT